MNRELERIAANMKRRAVANPGTIIVPETPLTHGARLRLKYNKELYEYRLQIQRDGKQPQNGTQRYTAWLGELATFARCFGIPTASGMEQQKGKQTYAAVLTWINSEEELKDYAQWTLQFASQVNESQGAQ